MHTLLTQEHDQLTAQLKTARRDAQRADAALRSEIEALKKAAEKNAAGEQRAKQKILALQEAVKQALAAAVETDNTVKEMERALPELEVRRAEAEAEHARASEEAGRSAAETKAALDADRKKTAEVEGELASLTTRLEKVTAKRDKLAGETVPELEKELAGIHLAIEEAHREKEREMEREREFNHEIDYPHHYTQPPPQPQPQPIRRPVHADSSPGAINVAAPPFVPRSVMGSGIGHSRGAGSVPIGVGMGRSNGVGIGAGPGGSKPHNHTASEGFLRGYPTLGDMQSQRVGIGAGGDGVASRKGSLPPGSERAVMWGVLPTQ
jgi:vacuolar-type H+-ATPase subunit D/Vma8